MADDVTFQDDTAATPPDGTKVATDEIGGAHHQLIKVEFGDPDSATPVSAANPLPVTQTGAPALPSGAATVAKQDILIGHVDGVEALLAGGLPSALSSDRLKVDGSGVTQPVSLASAPLPTGGATAANQTTLIGHVDGVETLLAGGLPSTLASDRLKVDGSGVTQPVSAAALPLPSGAATAALQGGGLPSALASDRLKVDGSGVTQPVSAASLPLPSGAATAALQGGGLPSALASDRLKVDASGVAVPITDNSGSLTVDAGIKTVYGTEAQALTCTLTSLASSATAGRESTVVDNTSNLFLDVLVFGIIKLTTGTPGNDKRVYIWAYGTVDAATPHYPDTVTGADAAITMNSPINLRLLGIIEAPAQSTTYKAGPWSLAQLFGSVPEKWGLVVQNYTNISFTSTASDHKMLYQGVTRKLV